MARILKSAIKAMLPAKAMASALELRERLALQQTQMTDFDSSALKVLSRQTVETAFLDQNITEAWERDLAKITNVMPYVDIYGGVCPGERRALYFLIALLKPRLMLEIGTHIGASTLVIAQALKTHGYPDSVLITGDILDVNDPAVGAYRTTKTPAPRDALEQLGLEQLVTFQVAPALDILRTIGSRADIIFLDGDHSAPAVYNEIAAALKVISPGGVILLHDYYPDNRAVFPEGVVIPGPSLAGKRITSENSGIHIVPLGTLPWETKQGVHATSLAYVTSAF